ncbi:trihelix transcription factor ASIL2-like [Ananas comosus]|uniref:Trihelix transcription factor ASIL2-like n=1 Tax=Ananas comosus TaxID=4615 RepID=A0A6P5GB40_ANACO|nr:trihelix transcription factor ASIL2-like [Ananas comosus]XP_020105845.1 trihelix transcription factor ASIL2-like [Ananas comosus]XP_020105846.1 trihelix transcription factor ASIL2-like [Ananas comosus]XP_020105847.1 trihelix transcription factor ASIL2-like [Ananas comosus]
MEGRETRGPPNPALPYREDCWSEGETSALVEAWGDRYLELNRGNLRQKHWQEVADAVNSRRGAAVSAGAGGGGGGGGGRRPPRTDVQCKNRIDTLKKKYKVEKARIADSAGALHSPWPFYARLDALIGSSTPPAAPHSSASASASASAAPKKPSSSPPFALPLPFHRKGFRKAAAAAAAAAADDDEDEESGSSSRSLSSRSKLGKRRRGRERDDGDGIRELARAIERFAEIYERVEGAKQRQMMELEKQRMEFAKGLEFQRMQIFVDSQVQLEKIKRSKRADAGEPIRSVAALHFLSTPRFFG